MFTVPDTRIECGTGQEEVREDMDILHWLLRTAGFRNTKIEFTDTLR